MGLSLVKGISPCFLAFSRGEIIPNVTGHHYIFHRKLFATSIIKVGSMASANDVVFVVSINNYSDGMKVLEHFKASLFSGGFRGCKCTPLWRNTKKWLSSRQQWHAATTTRRIQG